MTLLFNLSASNPNFKEKGFAGVYCSSNSTCFQALSVRLVKPASVSSQAGLKHSKKQDFKH